jgi:hypothetical protein
MLVPQSPHANTCFAHAGKQEAGANADMPNRDWLVSHPVPKQPTCSNRQCENLFNTYD